MRRDALLLVVEDDPELRELYRLELGLARFTNVHMCEDGLSALQYLDQEQPDLIVLDLNLPRVSGVDLYHELRAHRATEDIPIVVCTGTDPIPDLPDAVVVRKPCAADQLVRTVIRALDAHASPFHPRKPLRTARLGAGDRRAVPRPFSPDRRVFDGSFNQ